MSAKWYEVAFALMLAIGLKIIETHQKERDRQILKADIVRELRKAGR